MARNLLAKTELLIIIGLACIPLFIHFPYRVNIFLSWEGAYRISQGQLPFRDFGTPLGGVYWMIPAIFFKLLGPKMITLVKAQVFINIMAGICFRSILTSLSVDKGIRFASVLLFCLSYSFFNFWPWYNHSVIVYELAALACLFRYISVTGAAVVTLTGAGTAVAPGAVSSAATGLASPGAVAAAPGSRWRMAWLAGAGFLVCLSFLTKQDGGGMAFLLCCGLLACHGFLEGKWAPLGVFAISFFALLGLLILPLLHDGFGYWFNHGQPPHTARVSAFDIVSEFLGASQWIKFYFFLTLVIVLARWRKLAALWSDKKTVLLLLLTWGILGEAAIFQITSYTPPDNNIFFHSFALPCLLTLMAPMLPGYFGRPRALILMTVGILLWWSGIWWKYTQRLAAKILPYSTETVSPTGENIVNRMTYMNGAIPPDTTEIPMDKWVECGLPAFDKITMPPPTAAGIHRLMDMPLLKGHNELKLLNMSELTPLAVEIPYALERNPELPLWYHLGVGMFNRQAVLLEGRIRDHYYDLVLFEYIPNLNNFYPFRVRDSLRVHYRLVDSFMAPRRGETRGNIEVYVKPTQ